MSGASSSRGARAAAAVLAIGVAAAVSWWGTRGARGRAAGAAMAMVAGEGPAAEMPTRELCLTPEVEARALAEGAAINERDCAGCHGGHARLAAPSYAQIARAYEARGGDNRGLVLAALASAVHHPRPGWRGYPALVSPPRLAPDEDGVLAYWIERGAPAPNDTASAVEVPR